MKTILSREFKAYFTSPIGYVILVLFLFVFGFYCSANIMQLSGNYDYVINSLTILLVIGVPALTMKLLAEERKTKTDQLLLTAPIRVWDIVLGKYFAATLLLLFILALTGIQPIILAFLGDVPWPSVMSSYLGYFLLGSALIALSLFISALTESSITAALGSYGIFFALMLLDYIANFIPAKAISSLVFIFILIILLTLYIQSSIKDWYISLTVGFICGIGAIITYKLSSTLFEGLCVKILHWFSLFSRYENFTSGLLDIGSIFYFVSFIFVFLFLTNQSIEKRRWS